MTDKLKEALAKLDPNNDNHWTADGNPRIETLRMMTGTPSLTRDEVTKVDQEFNRDASRKRAADALEADKTRAEGEKRALGELAKAQNVDALGKPSGTPSPGMPGGEPVAGVTADSAAPGELKGADGTTANPTADSDNQLGTGDTTDADAQQAMERELQLKEQIAAGEDYLARITQQRDDLSKEMGTVSIQLDTLKNQLSSEEPDHLKNMETIQGYLRSSQAKRDRRAEQAREDDTGRKHVARGDKEPVDQKMESRKRDTSGQAAMIRQQGEK